MNKNNRLSTTLTTNTGVTNTTNTTNDLDAFLSGVTSPHIGLPTGEYIATVTELAAIDGTAVLKLTVYLNGAPKKANYRIFDTNRFITEFALANGYAIHSLNEAIGKTMPLYVEAGKYSMLPHLLPVGNYNATFKGLGSINLGKDRAAVYFKWQVEDHVFYDFTMYSVDTLDKIDRKISDIARALGLQDSFRRADLNNYVGHTVPLYIVQPEGLKSKFINYWKKPEDVMPEVAVDIVKF